jgi:transposase-like protein
MLYVRFALSLRYVEDLLHERGINVSHETVRFWWNRFGPMSPRISAQNGFNTCALIHIGNGTWARLS